MIPGPNTKLVPVDASREPFAYPIVTMTAFNFDCSFCDLVLNGAVELQAADLPTAVDIEDPDPQDFYDPPDEY